MSNQPVNLDELRAFLLHANMPHAEGTAETVKEADGSRTIEYAEGDYHMHDNFFGGEPYGGRLVIFYKGQGKQLFGSHIVNLKLKLLATKQIGESTVQNHYEVVK